MKIFSNQTATALCLHGFNDTAEFVDLVAGHIDVFNSKSPFKGTHLCKELAKPITSIESEPIVFLKRFSSMVDKMQLSSGRRKCGEFSLTRETSTATVKSINGFIRLAEYLLSKGYAYILFGRYNSDFIETRVWI